MGKNNKKKEVRIILHNVRSAHNVGSIFRTADAAGVDGIICTGYTPTPKDRFGRMRDDVAKVALGAERSVSWEHHDSIMDVLEKLEKEGFQIVAVEQSGNAADYKDVMVNTPAAFIFGNEVNGIPADVLHASDVVAQISMHGDKKSLNVSVAAGIALFGMLDL